MGVGRSVVLENESFAFTCDQDGNVTTHSYPRSGSDPYAEKSIIITSVGTTSHTVTDAPYDSVTGDVTITIANHGFSNGDYIKLSDNSLTYNCVLDDNVVSKSYPRAGYDYPSGRWLSILLFYRRALFLLFLAGLWLNLLLALYKFSCYW